MTASINGTTGVTFPDASVQGTAATGFGFKNRIINGAMMIDQRNAGASYTAGSGNNYCLDRWAASASQASKFAVQQNAGSVTPPAGFTNYLGVTSSSAYTVGSGEAFGIRQYIEGFNVSDLGWGAAGASSVTLSFWVRSSLTGLVGGALLNAAGDRSYPFSFTVSSANTWEQKTITIAGDTSGTWNNTNSIGINVSFNLGTGSTLSGTAGAWAGATYLAPTSAINVVGTNGATFYITGVQLEKGSTATSFDYRPYGTELALCQRYYWKPTNYQLGLTQGTNVTYRPTVQMPVTMRSAPTLDSGASYAIASGSAGTPAFLTGTGSTVTVDEAGFWNSNSNWSTGQWVSITCGLNAEL